MERLERALKINPYAPAYSRSYLSFAYCLIGRHEDGLEILKSVQRTVGPLRYARIAHLVALDRRAEARAAVELIIQENPGFGMRRVLAAWPLKRAEDRARLSEALRRAGLPE